jgi:hypothetical protein
MSINIKGKTVFGPNVVTDNMVLYLDAGNTKSYPGSGTSWKNIRGSSGNGTLSNGPTYSSDGGGSIIFDGVDDLLTVSNQSFASATGSSYTIGIWFKRNNTTPVNFDNVFLIGAGGTADARNWLAMDNNNNGQLALNYYIGAGKDYYITLDSNQNTTAWHYAVQVIDKSTSKMLGYYDGSYKSDISIDGSAYTATGPFYVAGANYADITVSQVQIYSRALSASEILQNYNSVKRRFGY